MFQKRPWVCLHVLQKRELEEYKSGGDNCIYLNSQKYARLGSSYLRITDVQV